MIRPGGAAGEGDPVQDTTIVVMTRDRVGELLDTLGKLVALPDQAPVTVVDNGSTDGTSEQVARQFPQVELITLPVNAGVEARNIAVERATTPYVAFNDDDSWWAPGSLGRAAELLKAHQRLGAVAADIVVEPYGRQDAASKEMRDSPLTGDPSLPGTPVLGFLACAAIVRRSAFLEVGGFHRRLHFGGEEELFATDLVAAGWELRYVEELTVHHQPSKSRDDVWRRRRGIRNTLWFLWLRRPAGHALRRSLRLLRDADRAAAVGGAIEALRGLPWVLRERRVVPWPVERQLRQLEPEQDRSESRRYGG